ncbi:MAG: exosome complex protein Rrp42 [Candidatus Aenigmarchaeota archaeon]|nr:exosome complex protein Rrp42 [Candidatus Aenigmarchaeota archaeon]
MRSDYILKLLEKDERLDGRKLDEFRKITIEKNVVAKAEGSARVRMGKTEVIVGIKIGVGEPFPDIPNMGMLRLDAEFTPMAHPDFSSGPPGEDATEVARVVDRAIRESEAIDLEKLCITEGEKVWSVFVDIYPINHDGNLIDASTLAAISALKNTKMPTLDKDGKIVREKLKNPLPIVHQPITVTVGKIGDKIILDPAFEEEELIDAKLSIGIREDGKVVSMQKSGSVGLSDDDVDKMIDIAVKKSKELRKLI